MMKQEVKVGPPHNLPFSSGIQTESLVFVSGQGGLKDGKVVGPDLASQTAQTMDNIREVLIAAGVDFNDVVKVQVYLKHRNDYNEFNELYASYFQAPFPTRTTIYCDLNFDILIEIDVIAVRKI